MKKYLYNTYFLISIFIIRINAINNYDLAYETILFKPCINPYHIMIFNSKKFNKSKRCRKY